MNKLIIAQTKYICSELQRSMAMSKVCLQLSLSKQQLALIGQKSQFDLAAEGFSI